ncbi:hypothetical protein CP533_6392 [Ophiocordyceps camponoti-saundersi (nom. inval.)]|nr:hypothetical protein CP533_6392 [Ophiocordyceps camponoti-saundersi (nom. inval.)]
MTTYSTNPALFIFTSLTAGSSHIVTATSRLETILRANRVPFKAVDVATDEKARMLWGRRSGKDATGRPRKLPGLVQEGLVLGDLVEIEDWNEYGELKQHVKIYYDEHTIPSIHDKPKQPQRKQQPKSQQKPPAPPAAPQDPPEAPSSSSSAAAAATAAASSSLPIRSVADEAAQKAKALRTKALREKVYGKEPAKVSKAAVEESPAFLQCPSTAAWPPGREDAPQSPTSARWPGGSSEPESKEAASEVPAAPVPSKDDAEPGHDGGGATKEAAVGE